MRRPANAMAHLAAMIVAGHVDSTRAEGNSFRRWLWWLPAFMLRLDEF